MFAFCSPFGCLFLFWAHTPVVCSEHLSRIIDSTFAVELQLMEPLDPRATGRHAALQPAGIRFQRWTFDDSSAFFNSFGFSLFAFFFVDSSVFQSLKEESFQRNLLIANLNWRVPIKERVSKTNTIAQEWRNIGAKSVYAVVNSIIIAIHSFEILRALKSWRLLYLWYSYNPHSQLDAFNFMSHAFRFKPDTS